MTIMHCASFASHLYSLAITAAIFTQCVSGADSNSNSNGSPLPHGEVDCDCFLTNGSSPAYYAKHMFFDFRNLTADARVPKIITDEASAIIAPPTSAYFNSTEWTAIWQLQGYNNSEGRNDSSLSGGASTPMVYSPANVYIQRNGDKDADSETYMTLRTQRLNTFQSAASFQTKAQNFQFVSLRMLSRTVGSPGAVTAMFTYHQPNDTGAAVQESDFEVLTRGPRERIQYTNQPAVNSDGSPSQGATKNVSLPNDLIWSQWAVHRLDWTPQSSVWYVDGQEAANINVQVPRDGSGINFNAWSNGGVWSGNMSVFDEASLQIQWIEMVYNTTTTTTNNSQSSTNKKRLWSGDVGPQGKFTKRAQGNTQCKVVCSIDETSVAGNATMLYNSTGTRIAGAEAGSHIVLVWTLFVGGLTWFWLL